MLLAYLRDPYLETIERPWFDGHMPTASFQERFEKFLLWLVPLGYLIATGLVLVVKCYLPFNRLLLYGKTQVKGTLLNTWVNTIAGLMVPKRFFTHFYILLSSLSTCLLVNFHNSVPKEGKSSQFLAIYTIQVCLFVQGVRRLYECLFLLKPSIHARINIFHYLVGIGHYTLISMNIFLGLQSVSTREKLQSHLLMPPLKIGLLLFWFAYASLQQYQNHRYLASLVKYSPPIQFKVVLCPHYWNEIQIYIVLAAISCTSMPWYDVPAVGIICSAVFVATNLSISSRETHKYYQQKYPLAMPASFSMVPGVL